MDTNMMDVDGDIIIDVDPIMEPEVTQAQQTVADVCAPAWRYSQLN